MAKEWTREEIEGKIMTDSEWLARGIVAIWKKQTASERMAGQTYDHNGVGFSGADAPFLSFCAKWLNEGAHRTKLSERFEGKARRMMKKYCGQLEKIARGEI